MDYRRRRLSGLKGANECGLSPAHFVESASADLYRIVDIPGGKVELIAWTTWRGT